MAEENELIKKAKKRVEDKKGFYVHLSVYISTGLFFLTMNVLNWEGKFWFFYPLLPWGIGLLIHYFAVFGLPISKVLSADWEERELAKEIERLKADNPDLDLNELKDNLELKELRKEEAEKKSKNWSDDELV